jgi:DnaK suppressor protein
MAAKKSVPKSGKAKNPVAAKPTAKPAAKPAASKVLAKKPVAKVVKATKPAPVAPRQPVALKPPAAVVARPTPSKPVEKPTVPAKRVVESTDDDGPDNGLLAGPRNVQPYVAKRGEQYMNKVQLGHFREILQTWKQDLMLEVDRTVSHMKDEAANFPDPNDRATQEEEFSLELRTRDRERKLIRKIDEAIKRIEDGSYGYCLETGEQIGVKRLEARPVATLSIEAQERRERREKQYGDRDDRYR